MNEEELIFVGDKLFVRTPLPQHGDVCKTQLVMTKEIFQACYEKWIEPLEQDTVPFDFELYQAGLMDMPEELVKVLDAIRAKNENGRNQNGTQMDTDKKETTES